MYRNLFTKIFPNSGSRHRSFSLSVEFNDVLLTRAGIEHNIPRSCLRLLVWATTLGDSNDDAG
jgi:hypothetical protein